MIDATLHPNWFLTIFDFASYRVSRVIAATASNMARTATRTNTVAQEEQSPKKKESPKKAGKDCFADKSHLN
jgi:hypothetical protein